MSVFDRMKEKSKKGSKPKPTNAQDAIDEVREELIAEQKAKELPKPTPPEVSPPKATTKTYKVPKLQKEVNNLKKELLDLRRDFTAQVQDILDSLTARQTTDQNIKRKLTFEEFVEHMLSHVNVGTHYSGYVKQYTGETTGTGYPKKTNFNHIYMIYLDLP